MPYLINYSHAEKGREVFANDVTEMTPARWLHGINKKYPDIYNRLYFAIEITKEEYDLLDGEI
jgi:hypothetical protein